ncbi:protein-L-isoaspartate(D-aspartate) O-methyltransferase [Blastopirellula marina]|uniref:Protein-L-isoaspartate O-methyltransferase n=1 Tax=Blastopirellula marina TaxID=124 RepID=A0A2S8GEA1_9BACT|nr:protein-L-isoaspartate(D-aspartate) O-methyltransferase [Blastopirellula marina]PQO42785.1 protein-L-isoaspartate(D-aspartate) O-methyltransferase [Blastopirellula marina]PTL46551.1 protein-L-isoaspartate(D-aspartate) O-methyltransferase [Blastopirellula marina]
MNRSQSTTAWLLAVTFLALVVARTADARDPYEAARNNLVDTAIVANGVKDPRVIKSVRDTQRHEFVSASQRPQAYYDMALPIGEDQTISSPFIVAYMTESLEPKPTDKVLEIGTGSGYQAAILSPLVKDVYSIEIKEVLGRKAARTLQRLGYENVHTKVGDGYLGWPQYAPFDKIIVTCSPENVPQPLIDQLREGGKMVIPVGERYQQTLVLFTKKDGKLEADPLRPTLFVPMTGEAEDRREVKPDPANPRLENGDFEEPLAENSTVPGWYYQRQLELVEDSASPSGSHCLKLSNSDPGRVALALQGLALDGRQVHKLSIKGWVKTDGVGFGADRTLAPMLVISYYDEQRRELGRSAVGPFIGTQDWHEVDKTVSVPPTTREALFRISTFGAVGTMYVDKVSIETVR